jgi:hypothetical protein
MPHFGPEDLNRRRFDERAVTAAGTDSFDVVAYCLVHQDPEPTRTIPDRLRPVAERSSSGNTAGLLLDGLIRGFTDLAFLSAAQVAASCRMRAIA